MRGDLTLQAAVPVARSADAISIAVLDTVDNAVMLLVRVRSSSSSSR